MSNFIIDTLIGLGLVILIITIYNKYHKYEVNRYISIFVGISLILFISYSVGNLVTSLWR